jgi:hypothetical protein
MVAISNAPTISSEVIERVVVNKWNESLFFNIHKR